MSIREDSGVRKQEENGSLRSIPRPAGLRSQPEDRIQRFVDRSPYPLDQTCGFAKHRTHQIPPMKIKEIAFSCYPVTDMARAKSFYEGILGLTATMDHRMGDAHWVEYEIGTGTLALGLTEGMRPSRDGCSVALEVEDFEAAIADLKAAGIEFMFGPLETPVCHMAFVRDPDGNSVGIHQQKPKCLADGPQGS